MQVRTVRQWTNEVPAAWETALRAFSPVSTVHSWLAFRWFSIQKVTEAGIVEAGRWVLYECVHESLIPGVDKDIVDMLGGCPPSRMKNPNARMVRLQFVDDWQCEMYRKHRVWARPCWVLQGPAGGHAVVYAEAEQKLLQLRGLPTEPPAVGDLPYAEFDTRAIAQLRSRNRLIQLGNDLDKLKSSGNAAVMEAERQAQLKAYRAEYVQHLENQMAPCVDFLAWYTTSAKTATECRETLPETSRAQADAAALTKERYIDTGDIPRVAA